jgi:ATP-dependent helicase Lhr and Lhr-like helicase
MRASLCDVDIPARMTRRGTQTLEGLREEFWWAEDASTAVVKDEHGNQRWWTFAGLRANAELADHLGDLSRGSRSRDNLSIGLAEGVTTADVDARLQSLREAPPLQGASFTTRNLPKFAECLPPQLASSTVAIRYTDSDSVRACLAERIRFVAGTVSVG